MIINKNTPIHTNLIADSKPAIDWLDQYWLKPRKQSIGIRLKRMIQPKLPEMKNAADA